VLGTTSFLKQQEITGLFTATTSSLMGGTSITASNISTLTDSIILPLKAIMMNALTVGASLTPVMAIFIAFSILPIIAVIVFSFFRYSFSYPDHSFRGLTYYQQLTADPLFWNGLKRTAEFVVLAVPLNILVSLPAALGLQRVTRLKGTLRAFFFLPTIISTVAVSLLGLALYDPTTGLINQMFIALHLPIGHWLSDTGTSLPALVVLAVWQDTGYNVIIFLAWLQATPRDLYEAAPIA